MGTQPQACFDIGCPVAGKFHGFALPSGDFSKVKIVALLETPATNEIAWPVKDLSDGQQEIERRRKMWPGLDGAFITKGAAVVGKAGSTLFSWMLQPMGIHRTDIGLVNTISCYPGKKPDGTVAYPIGDVRKRAEACCQTLWWKPLLEWKPTVSIVCLHPSAISREVSPLPMCLKAIEKARHFADQGERVLLLMGGKAAKAWLGHAENTTTFCNHYEPETSLLHQMREERRAKGMATKTGPKEKRPKKLTAKAALELLIENAALVVRAAVEGLDGSPITGEVCYHINKYISEGQYKEIAGLIAGKAKKSKPLGTGDKE